MPAHDEERKPDAGEDRQKPSGPSSLGSAMSQAAPWFDLAFLIPAGILLGYFVGWLIARGVHAEWPKLAGVVLGAVIGFVGMIRKAVKMSQ